MIKVLTWPYHIVKKFMAGGYCKIHKQYFERIPNTEHDFTPNVVIFQCRTCYKQIRHRYDVPRDNRLRDMFPISMTRHEEETRREEEEETRREEEEEARIQLA